jgi:AraC-like DNA-binding protein
MPARSAGRLDIHARSLLDVGDLRITDVRCTTHASGWSPPDVCPTHRMVLVRDGVFRRRGCSGEDVLDSTTGYLRVPGDEHEIAHPADAGDRFTAIELTAGLAHAAALPAGSACFRTSAALDLEHRLLLAALRRGDEGDAEERALTLVACALGTQRPRDGPSAHRRLARDARELLALEPALTLPELAKRLHYSPHHVSRVFAAQAGEPIARHRTRLRVRWVAERLADGERDLGRLAADVGLSDPSHLTRLVRREHSLLPSGLRDALAPERLCGRDD